MIEWLPTASGSGRRAEGGHAAGVKRARAQGGRAVEEGHRAGGRAGAGDAAVTVAVKVTA